MAAYMKWQKEALTPCFVLLRRKGIYASTRSVACCTTCAHAQAHGQSNCYLGFTAQDRDAAREARSSGELRLWLFHHFPSSAEAKTAVKILRRFFHVTWNYRQAHKILIKVKKDRWQEIRNFVKIRRVAVYWQSLTAQHYEPPHGRGYKRDLAAFLQDF